MVDRTATDALRGFFYQFDYSIHSILNLKNDDDFLIIEGVEDIDIVTATEASAIQCKYYEKTEYNHSVIAKPIRLMLNHFKEVIDCRTPEVKYIIRGYYKSGHTKLVLPIKLSYLKDHFLTYIKTEKINKVDTKVQHFHHRELKITDVQLTKFIELLELDIHALEFEKQTASLIQLFINQFNCSPFQAEYFYYNNALRIIRDLSKDHDIKNRKITKKEFLQRVNTADHLYNEWFVQRKGEKELNALLRKKYFAALNISHKERFFLIEVDSNNYQRTELRDTINSIIRKYAKIKNQPTPFCPYIYIHGITMSELIELKLDLMSDKVILSDGFDFEGAEFNPDSLVKKIKAEHPINVRFINRIEYLTSLLLLTGRKTELYQFYFDSKYFNYINDSIKNVNFQINNFTHIKDII